MAVDTAQKRRSSLYSLMPFFTPSVSIDGTMSKADRQESAWAYSGILALAGGLRTVTLLSATVPQPAITASVPQPTATTTVAQPTITIDEKNDIS